MTKKLRSDNCNFYSNLFFEELFNDVVFFAKKLFQKGVEGTQKVTEGGIQALRRQETPELRHKNRTDEEIEQLVINSSLKNPHMGQAQVSRQFGLNHNVEISPSGVR